MACAAGVAVCGDPGELEVGVGCLVGTGVGFVRAAIIKHGISQGFNTAIELAT